MEEEKCYRLLLPKEETISLALRTLPLTFTAESNENYLSIPNEKSYFDSRQEQEVFISSKTSIRL